MVLTTLPDEAAPPPQETIGRALVTVSAPALPERAGFAVIRPDTAFVAHLIAAAVNAPQTRSLRRASPEQALVSYRGTVRSRPASHAETGALMSRKA